MQVSFLLKRADFYALRYAQLGQDTASAFWLVRVVFPMLLLVGAASSFAATVYLMRSPLQFLVPGLFFAALLLGPFIGNERAWRLTRRRRNLRFETTVTLSLQGVTVLEGSVETFTPWTEMGTVRSHTDHIVLLRKNRMGIAIPKSAFPSPTQTEDFIRFAYAHWKQSRPMSANSDAPPLASPH